VTFGEQLTYNKVWRGFSLPGARSTSGVLYQYSVPINLVPSLSPDELNETCSVSHFLHISLFLSLNAVRREIGSALISKSSYRLLG
jgi:hypothetical protein